jgi:hypothetical protein
LVSAYDRERELDLDDYHEVNAIDGNGHDHADGENKPVNGGGHEQQK